MIKNINTWMSIVDTTIKTLLVWQVCGVIQMLYFRNRRNLWRLRQVTSCRDERQIISYAGDVCLGEQ